MILDDIYSQSTVIPDQGDWGKLARKQPQMNWYHVPGQNAAIRFFDPESKDDLFAMRAILNEKNVKKWMDNANKLSFSEYKYWAGTAGKTSFLFAVHDVRETNSELQQVVKGFVYLYSEREEKFRVKRMERLGLIEPTSRDRIAFEISFAASQPTPAVNRTPGLMSSAVRLACLQAVLLVSQPSELDLLIFGFVDETNLPAQRTLEASGFIKKGLMKYDADSESDTVLYVLDWAVLHQRIKTKLLEVI